MPNLFKSSQIWLLVLLALCATLFFASVAGVLAQKSAARLPAAMHTLTNTEHRYNLTDLRYSTGFFPADKAFSPAAIASSVLPNTATLRPKLQQSHRQWLYAMVGNQTNETRWVVHISQFHDYKKLKLWACDAKAVACVEALPVELKRAVTNPIGRGLSVNLPKNSMMLLALDVQFKPAFIAHAVDILSEPNYQAWVQRLNYTVKFAWGFISCIIVLSALFYVLIRNITFFWFCFSSSLLFLFYLVRASSLIQYPNLYDQVYWGFSALIQLPQIMFAASFLNVNKQSGIVYKAFIAAIAAVLVIFLLGYFVSMPGKHLLYLLSNLVVYLFVFFSGFKTMRANSHYYTLYMLGWFALLIPFCDKVYLSVIQNFETSEILLSYKPVAVFYYQMAHMLLHALAMILQLQQIRKSTLHAQLLSEAKSRFIAANSHDLRQPLHTMQIFLDDLSAYVNTREGNTILKSLRMTAGKINKTFEAVLMLIKLEAGVVQVHIQQVRLSTIYGNLYSHFKPFADQNQVYFKVNTNSSLVSSDPQLLEQLLGHLLSNAIKFARGGKVLVSTRVVAGSVIIEVSDTGRGIAKAEQNKIFDVYHRIGGEEGRANNIGIGLSIVKHLSELLQHPIKLRSNPGKGSVFSLSVPVSSEVRERNAMVDTFLSKLFVVVCVNDQAINEYLMDLLARWHYSVRSVPDLQGLEQDTELETDVIICDLPSLVASRFLGDIDTTQSAAFNKTLTVAVLCDSPQAVPDTVKQANCLLLNLPLQPSQLRALLNHAASSV